MMRCICGMIVDHAGASNMHVFALEKFGLKLFLIFPLDLYRLHRNE